MSRATRHGVMELIVKDRIVSRCLDDYGEWAQSEIDLISRIVRPGDKVMDVGANIGIHSLALARMVGVSGRVDAIEPRPELFEILDRNVRNNACSWVFLHQAGAGNKRGSIYVEPIDLDVEENFGGLELMGCENDAGKQVQIMPLDDIVTDRLDFVKIDVEGMEGEVLAGLKKSIADYSPIILAECSSLARAICVLGFAREANLSVYGCVFPSFNPSNFRNNMDNWLGDSCELGLLLVPSKRICDVASLDALAQIFDEDDLVDLLLRKPQYYSEVLSLTSVHRKWGEQRERIEHRFARQRINEIEEDRAKRLTLILSLQSEMASLRQHIDEIEADRAARLRVIHQEQRDNAFLRQSIEEISADRDLQVSIVTRLKEEQFLLARRLGESEAGEALKAPAYEWVASINKSPFGMLIRLFFRVLRRPLPSV